jgi:MFS family permease
MTAPVSVDRVRRRTVVVLVGTQIAGGVGVAGGITVASLDAARLSGSDVVAGAAQTASVIGAALSAVPLSRLADRRGRRPALVAGYLLAAAGGLVAAAAMALGNWPLLLAGLLFFGCSTSSGLSARFAATDLAEPDNRARLLSVVVWAVTVGAVAGPNLAAPVERLAGGWGIVPAAGPFLGSAVMFGLAAGFAGAGLRPDPLLLARAREASATDGPAATAVGPSPWRTLRDHPAALVAVTAIAVSHAAMVGLMSLTPVHMDHGGASLRLVGLVISVHVAGMYALSPVFGWVADRFGRAPVLVAGAGLLMVAGMVSASAGGADAGRLGVGLVALGLGWSAALVAGSALLTDTVPMAERARVQGLSDLVMNVSGAIGGVLAGAVLALASYPALGFGVAALGALLLGRVLIGRP